MDFFSQQDKARRNTGWLVILFVLAVLSLILLTNLLIGLTVWFMTQEDTMQRGLSVISQTDQSTISSLFSWKTFLLISLGVGGAVLCAILYKWFQLSSGGKAVAESLGGRRIYPNTEDSDEKQILNVIEEMALASGMPVPAVYLMEYELGINAFAAGNTPADAVIGVTKGCIQHFKRDELQGVIAHEFSHILNGDMRLNLRLMALLHGIVFIGLVGEMMLRGSGHRRSGGRVAALGFALMLIGWLGTFFGNLIKAAVSRQREYLADASAVQFTRNPDGIANALKLIGGYTQGTEITNSHRSEMSHMFFGQAIRKMGDMLATHPPLVDRILKVDPDWDGNYLHRGSATRLKKQQSDQQEREKKREVFTQTVLTGAAVAAGVDAEKLFSQDTSLDQLRDEIDGIPALLHEQAHDPLGAIALCYALLLHRDEQLLKTQMKIISQSGISGVDRFVNDMQADIQRLSKASRLPLIELLLPALKCMSIEQYKVFKRTLMLLIRADRKTDLFEWCLFQLVRHYLAGEFEPDKKRKPKFKEVGQVSDEYQLVLSLLAHHGHETPEDAERAFNRGASSAGLYNISILPFEECELERFIQSVHALGNAYPILKPRLLSGFRNCIAQDGKITVEEKEMVSSIAAVMDSPIPIFEQGTA
ncbi:M48 family metallopeptidase [Neptuniibacter sp.]|uniref:M48 family metallopeptidase n=1 Tax=Neptuniibacter sp. TaxID=1962643 RepID=UPI00262486D7|nr:M48 family metallopeptidase [Neptuniibacter sp.]MCP4598405.1 M48 family metallopeptidase [Neptuniibacter sp.]